jgi:hypothetical protein
MSMNRVSECFSAIGTTRCVSQSLARLHALENKYPLLRRATTVPPSFINRVQCTAFVRTYEFPFFRFSLSLDPTELVSILILFIITFLLSTLHQAFSVHRHHVSSNYATHHLLQLSAGQCWLNIGRCFLLPGRLTCRVRLYRQHHSPPVTHQTTWTAPPSKGPDAGPDR